MAARWIMFLLCAVLVMVLGLGVAGGWLLPKLGLAEAAARAIGTGLAGAVIAILYFRMIKGGGDAR